jgi:1-acyl-sn-glycerol-3-phosphate acyltransferase
MNIFKTGPRFIRGYIETMRFTSLKKKLNKLREAGDIEGEKELIRFGQKRWVEAMTPVLGLTYEVKGEENVPSPEDGPFMIYSNHQGFADIPATLWLMKDRFQLGYVAKEEWRKYPTLRDVVESTRSIFLVRDNPKEAIKALSEAKELLDQGFNLVIFPEGHRSKGHQMGEFKAGAFKFAEKAKVPILPITIDGSYKLFEEKGSYQPCHIKITVHPLVHIEEMDKHEQKEAQAQIEETIRGAL